MTTDNNELARQAVRTRPELARHLLARVDPLEACLGGKSLAAEILP